MAYDYGTDQLLYVLESIPKVPLNSDLSGLVHLK